MTAALSNIIALQKAGWALQERKKYIQKESLYFPLPITAGE